MEIHKRILREADLGQIIKYIGENDVPLSVGNAALKTKIKTEGWPAANEADMRKLLLDHEATQRTVAQMGEDAKAMNVDKFIEKHKDGHLAAKRSVAILRNLGNSAEAELAQAKTVEELDRIYINWKPMKQWASQRNYIARHEALKPAEHHAAQLQAFRHKEEIKE